jgi:enoyl-CoA hydratase/carnithine racemase
MISWCLQEGVYELALGRAPCNEIGTTMLAELERFLDALDTEAASALVIHSTVKGGFSAGADLRELYEGLFDVADGEQEPLLRAFLDRIHRVMDRLDMLPLTTIGVVHGVCFGGGFELALTCDLLIAERSALLLPRAAPRSNPRLRGDPPLAPRRLQRVGARPAADRSQHQRKKGAVGGPGQPDGGAR